jgi:hypothetical protein
MRVMPGRAQRLTLAGVGPAVVTGIGLLLA